MHSNNNNSVIPDSIKEQTLLNESHNEVKKIRDSVLGRRNSSRKEVEHRALEIKNKEKNKLKQKKEREAIKAMVHAETETEQLLGINIDEVIEENTSGKAIDKMDIDSRIYVIPSKLYVSKIKNHELTKKEATQIDDEQFTRRMGKRFNTEMISDYIEVMFDIFDIEAYYQIERKVKTKDGSIKTEYETVPNDLPLFSKFASSVGLTKSDINYLNEHFPRFARAYEMCQDMQENILITNMLLSNYSSNAAMFAAKNLLGWKSENIIGVSGGLNLGSLISKIQTKDNMVDFVAS